MINVVGTLFIGTDMEYRCTYEVKKGNTHYSFYSAVSKTV